MINFDDAFELWKDWSEDNMKAKTAQPMRSRYLRHLRRSIGRIRLDTMDEVRARKVIRNLKLKGLDQPTIKQCMNVINSIFAACREAGEWQGKSPLWGMSVRKSKHRRVRTLSKDQCHVILSAFKAASRPLYWTLAVLCYRLGMRPSEVLSLRPMDISDGVITVPDVKNPNGQAKTRKLFVNSTVVKEAVAYLEGLPVQPFERFFPKYIDHKYVNKIFTSCGHNEGIAPRDTVNRVTLYTLRHSYATQMLEEGADINQVQGAMGHDSVASTMVYIHAANTAGREGQAILDAALDKPKTPALRVVNGGI
jgi:integrase